MLFAFLVFYRHFFILVLVVMTLTITAERRPLSLGDGLRWKQWEESAFVELATVALVLQAGTQLRYRENTCLKLKSLRMPKLLFEPSPRCYHTEPIF